MLGESRGGKRVLRGGGNEMKWWVLCCCWGGVVVSWSELVIHLILESGMSRQVQEFTAVFTFLLSDVFSGDN